jgi:ABC-type antimicrobial peptide transport system permease subunit
MAVMLAREVLAAKLRLPGRANLILLGEPAGKAGQSDDANAANASLRRVWRLSDAELELRELDKLGVLELRTRRVLLDAAAVRAAAAADREATGLQTYFAKELRVGDRSTPYSIVTAIGPLNPRQRATASASMPSTRPIDPVPPDMQDGQVLINSWLERDLDAQPGQKLQMTYLVVGPMLKLQERTATFTIRDASVPVEAGDREMLPEIPGVPADDDPRKWKIGIKIEEGKWREDIDGKYWREHRGTPKAFLTLRAGRAIWASRFGDLTAVRWRLAPGLKGRVEAALRANLDPAAVGLFFLPVRKQALAAADQALDFGQLFLGLSFFLIVAALLLTVLLFVLGVEQRRQEVGLLLAVGLRPGQVRRMLLLEGAALAVMGGIIGAAGGLLYTRALLHGLSTVWSGAVAGSAIRFHADPLTVAIGAAGGVAASLVAIWLAVRRQTRRPARELLAGGPVESVRTGASAPRGRMPWWRARSALILAVCATVAAAIAGILGLVGITSPVAAFFVAGALMLAAGIAASRWGLKALARASGARRLTLAGLAVRNSSRRPGRSLAVISLLACGSFLIIAVAAFRQDASHEPRVRSSGTGGFALYGESSLPILRDLNDPNDRKRYRFGEGAMAGVSVVAMRVHEGDDASCLNLNRAQSPRLLGVRPEDLKGRFTFVKTDAEGAEPDPWSLLSRKRDDGAIPAIGDEPTVVWGLGKKLGDTLFYVDEKAAGFKVRIVGITAGSILQGSLLISREDFEAKFPSRSGYRAFLVDAPADRADGVSQAMSQALEDFGLELSPAAKRLGEFSTVQNTYLSIFQLLGGLGMLLGSAGLALVVARNVLERRGELAILRAVGFRRAAVRLMVFAEHGLLLLAGLACGLIAAAVAIGPMLGSPGVKVPVGWLSLMLGAVLVSGALWTGVATAWAVRGPLLAALRNE